MGTTQRPARAAALAFYLKSSVRLSFEPLMSSENLEQAAFADWAEGYEDMPSGSVCEEIDLSLRSIRILLTREISEGAKEKLEHDREALELLLVRAFYKAQAARLGGLFRRRKVRRDEILERIEKASEDAEFRFVSAPTAEIQMEILRYRVNTLRDLELDARYLPC